MLWPAWQMNRFAWKSAVLVSPASLKEMDALPVDDPTERKTRPPTIRDVASRAGVSIGTVSGVIHSRSTIKKDIRVRVVQAISELGYSPNAVAQSMRLGSTKTIGVVTPHINAPFLADWVSAAQDVFHAAGYATLLGTYNGQRERESELIRVLVRRKADALLIAQNSEFDEELQELLKMVQVPIVLMDRELPEWANSVTVDHRGAMRRATDYLIKLGHRRIGAILGGESIYPARERLIGYRMAHEAAGITIDPRLIGNESILADNGRYQTRQMCMSSEPPTAIIAGGMPLPGILRALKELELRIPEDMSVIAASASDLAELMTPSLSHQRWNAIELGQTAARIVLERIEQGNSGSPTRVMIPSEFIVRDSCSPPKSLAMLEES